MPNAFWWTIILAVAVILYLLLKGAIQRTKGEKLYLWYLAEANRAHCEWDSYYAAVWSTASAKSRGYLLEEQVDHLLLIADTARGFYALAMEQPLPWWRKIKTPVA